MVEEINLFFTFARFAGSLLKEASLLFDLRFCYAKARYMKKIKARKFLKVIWGIVIFLVILSMLIFLIIPLF